MAQPQAWHRVEAVTDDVEWYLEFYCKPEDYFPKKYNTNPVHSEVLEAMQTVKTRKSLGFGLVVRAVTLSFLHRMVLMLQL